MSVYTTFAVVRVFFIWTPGSLVHKHVKNEAVLLQVQNLKVVVQIKAFEKAVGHEVVFYTFVLEVPVDLLNGFQIFQFEAQEIEWRFCYIVGNHEGSVEAIVTEQFELLGVVITCEGFFLAFHVKNVQIKVCSA